ncbi:F-box/FBD/LRR-repeat protein At3g52680-like [Lotus japonicus]|uniref:F-box/FBD/LRR-repeat protein At3g52680-like n=1 Tax=Lotus japonicus TaxID=34305 RepID=UPI0025868FBF|nr:F-box/FBD/LRR-repeat protein At3g52680-like [Lotus japonicus]
MDDDTISSLPDAILSRILSFLPTKHAAATSVLSKRWKPLWRSVSTLHFDDTLYVKSNYTGMNNFHKIREDYSRFLQCVYAVMLYRDLHLPIHTFRLHCDSCEFYDPTNVTIWVNAAVQRKVQDLELSLGFHPCNIDRRPTNLSSIFTCTTLVVLKLCQIDLIPFSSGVDLPSLKVLHLQDLIFLERESLAKLLSGSPNLEDFKARGLRFDNYNTDREFKPLPKLVRADISATQTCFLFTEVVNNVQFLHLDKIPSRLLLEPQWIDLDLGYIFPMFHNLTHVELVYQRYNSDWSQVVEFLHHCPKLQVLSIHQTDFHYIDSRQIEKSGDWQFPPSVPQCILLHLRRCYLNGYRGTKAEFEFARYIMENGRFLKSMAISSGIAGNQKFKMLKELSYCQRSSATCRLSFK